jgi:hypothetical protein
MGLRDKLDTLVHGGVHQPPSHERKKNYELGDVLGKLADRNRSKVTKPRLSSSNIVYSQEVDHTDRSSEQHVYQMVSRSQSKSFPRRMSLAISTWF